MLVLIRCLNIQSDPRAMKYVKYLQENEFPFYLIGWDRDNVVSDSTNASFYKKKVGYNVGGLKAAFNRIGWMYFVFRELKKLKNDNIVLHCCDIDAAFPAVLYKKLFNRKAYILFDVFDWFSASMSNQNKLILTSFKFMEKISMSATNHYFICEPERMDQFPVPVEESKVSVFPNIPYFKDSSFLVRDSSYAFNNDLLTFSYVGSFTNERCLSEIISLAERGIINLIIAGFGTQELECRLKDLNRNEHIKYYGKVKYQDGLNIMYNSDVIYAMYSKVLPNHVYAAPNKYYEAMFLGKAIFTTEGTFVGQKVKNNDIGFVSEEKEEDIMIVIQGMNKEEITRKGQKAHQLWDNEFSTYTQNFLNTKYREIVGK